MKKNIQNIVFAVGLTILLLGMVAFRFSTTYGDVDAEKESLEQMESERTNVEQILAALEAQKSDSEAYLKELDNQMSEIAAKLYNLQTQIDAKNQEITVTQELIAKTQEEINEQYAAMKLRIQFMYENGNASYLAMIFDSKSIGDFLNRAEYIGELTSYDRQMLDELQAKKNENEAAKAVLDSQLAELQTLQADAETEKAATEQLLAAKNAEVEAINNSITDVQNKIQTLHEDIAAQQSLIAEMESIEARRAAEEQSRLAAEAESIRLAEEEASRIAAEEASKKAEAEKRGETYIEKETTKSSKSTGSTTSGEKFQWPLSDYSYISSHFCMRENPFGGTNTEFHNGIDIPAPTGTAVHAVAGGQVAWAYTSASAGNWIGIDHGNGVYSVYMHMSYLIAKEGDYVSAGQTIGLVGSTGRSTGPHLHLSIRLNGTYVDPLNYVSP